MSGDYSRITFDPWHDDLGVLLQQGRPLTDADWNALVLQLRRRVQAGTLDTIGVAVVPMQTPDGFEIILDGSGGLDIGRGRIYVDGLLAENHGDAPLTWEPRLEELIGTEPVDYTEQPYYPNPAALPEGGPHLIYLDVWQREVTHLIRPELIEKAVGVDSCTRLQTVWQVKLLPDIGAADCSTPLQDFPSWLPANGASGGRLTTTTVAVPGEPDPCHVPVAEGYKGRENQLYRLEIHEGGPPGTATFTWSRDNGSVQARVIQIPSLTQLVVDSIGKDSVQRFSDGDWVDITDDWRELHNLPGELRRIKVGGGVDDPSRTITLEQPLTAGLFPTDVNHDTEPGRHTRVRRWDQKGQIRDENGGDFQDLDLPTSNGAITVPTTSTVGLLLEHGIVARFSIAPEGGEFRSGDHWVCSARTSDASLEELVEAPPRGIHHHYAKLAIVTFPDQITDCRNFWPPPPTVVTGGDTCACTVCVAPQGHASGQLTVQMAIDQVVLAGGGTVCLEVGEYMIAQPLSIQGATSLHLVGKGIASRLRSTGRILVIGGGQNIVLESFAMLSRPAAQTPDAVLIIQSSQDVSVERLRIQIENNNPAWAAVGLSGALIDLSFNANTFIGSIGIRGADPTGGQTGLTDLRIDDNVFDCSSIAVQLAGVTVHQMVSRLRSNRVTGCQQAGFMLSGSTGPGFGVEVSGNVLAVNGAGVVAGMDGLRVLDNDILRVGPAGPNNHIGVELMPGVANQNGLESGEILGNRIAGFGGAAILARLPRVRALMIKQNQIERVGAGVMFEGATVLDQLAIENNQFSTVDGFAIRAEGNGARLLTSGNHIDTRGASAAVRLMFETGESVFTHNQCRREGAADADVVLGADTLVVSSNRVHGGGISLDLHVEPRRCTVLGNIAHGKIIVGGAALQPPWLPLNLEGI